MNKTNAGLAFIRPHRILFGLSAVAIAILALLAWNSADVDTEQGVRPEALMRADDMEGMDMTSDGSVRLTPAQLREFGISFATVELRGISSEVRTVGTVVVDETRTASITTKVAGFVERLYVNVTGQPVERSQPLFELYSPELVATQEELLLASRIESSVQSDVPGVPVGSVNLRAAARQRLRLWDVSETQIDQILRAGTARRTVTLFSPAAGTVLEKNVTAGQAVEPGEVLYRIADLSHVWVEAQVREADAAAVAIGAIATIESPAFPGRSISGRVEYVYPTLEAQARALRVRVPVPNPGGTLRPGTYVSVRLSVPGRTAMSIPTHAVVNTGQRSVVFVDFGNGRIVPRQVVVGAASDEYVEILSGLESGQRVVTSAQFLLDSESNLAEVMRSMISQGTSGMEPAGSRGDGSGSMPGMNMPSATR